MKTYAGMFAGLYCDIKYLLNEMSQGYAPALYNLIFPRVKLCIACLWARMGQQEGLSSGSVMLDSLYDGHSGCLL
jgi:hypothetical protein